MTNPAGDDLNVKLLEATLETYGADRTRWPAQLRRELTSVVAQSRAAQRLVAECQALDRLLDLAPVVAAGKRAALADRIVAAAGIEQRSSVVSRSRARPSTPRGWENVYAGMALAASLMLGVLAGSNPTLAPAIQDMAAATGWDAGASTGQVAVNDDDMGLANEDLL